MAQEIYTKITELTPASNILDTDEIMISRPTDDAGNYVSYKCDYDMLSSTMKKDVMGQIDYAIDVLSNLNICKSVSDLDPTGDRLVAEKVIKAIADGASSGSSGSSAALLKNTSALQNVIGPVTFLGALKCENPTVYSGNDVVNYAALSNYVATAGIMPFFKGCSGTEPDYVYADSSKAVKALLYPIYNDCIALITISSTVNYLDFCIFAFCVTCRSDGDNIDKIIKEVQADLDAGNEIEDSDYCVMDHINVVANKPMIVNLPIRSKNILAFFPKGVYNKTSGVFKPDHSATISKNSLRITVVKYESYSS